MVPNRRRFLSVLCTTVVCAIVLGCVWAARALNGGQPIAKGSVILTGSITDSPGAGVIVPDKRPYDRRRDVSISFPDGTEVVVNFRSAPKMPSSLPTILAEAYDSLVSVAEAGDKTAALTLFKGLSICDTFIYETPEQLDQAIQDLWQTHTYKLKSRDGTIESYGAGTFNVEDELRNVFRFCDGITSEQKSNAVKWLRQAANLGHARAAQDLVMGWIGNTVEGRKYLRKSFEAGWYNSGAILADYLDGGINHLPGIEQRIDDIHQDRVHAYAYRYLFTKLLEADSAIDVRATELMKEQLTNHENSMSPHEVSVGLKKAKEIMLKYSECCFSFE